MNTSGFLRPTYVDLSLDYFDSLLNRAVPLPEHHIAALSTAAWRSTFTHGSRSDFTAFHPTSPLSFLGRHTMHSSDKAMKGGLENSAKTSGPP
jgi:hypothetical protein